MEQKKKFIINMTFYLLAGGILWGVCRYILPIISPFLAAFLIAAFVQIPVKGICKNSDRKQKVCSAVCVSIFYIALFALVILAGTKILQGAGALIEAAPSFYSDKIVPIMESLSDRIEAAASSIDIGMSQKIESMFHELVQNTGKQISNSSVEIVKVLSEGIAGIPALIVKLVVMVVATFFIAMDYDRILDFMKKHIPPKYMAILDSGKKYAKNAFFIYLKSYTMLFFITFVELSVGLWILGIPYAVLVGLGIAVFDILPVLGTGGVLLPWAVVLFLMKEHMLAAGIILLYVVIVVIRNILEPRLIGRQIGLHPLVTLIAMFLGLKLVGILGMIAFPVALTVLISLKRGKEK